MNLLNISNMLRLCPNAKFLDLGCADGSWTKACAELIGTSHVYGVEIDDKLAALAEEKGVIVKRSDLNREMPFDDEYFDIITANQVIEHLYDTSSFILEIKRILKKDGYAIISTENASSWHNILSLILGWQMFSLTNICHLNGIGNPLAANKGSINRSKSMEHIRIFSYLGLIEYIEAFGLINDGMDGSGYYPFPCWLGKIDRRHSHFITIKFKKP